MSSVTFPFRDMPAWATEWASRSDWFDQFHRGLGHDIVNFDHTQGAVALHKMVCEKAPKFGVHCFSMVDDKLHITLEVTPELTKHILSFRD